MRWFKRHRPTEDDRVTLQQAQSMREQAELKLAEARQAAREVSNVVIEARQIRKDNQFSQRLNEAFESRPKNNG
jgi:hypothetical protein